MLTGEYQHSMDPKGRVTVPSRFREDLGDRFYVSTGKDGCLILLSEEQFRRLAENIAAMPPAQARVLQRVMFSKAAEVEPDKQGRILIPPGLREYAGLQREVVLIGASTRAELWDADRWAQYNAAQSQEDIEAVMDLLIF